MVKHVVTGAFGFSGKYIASRLLDAGVEVHTLTNSLGREHPFGDQITASAYHFDEPDKLRRSLEGARVLYNTYWVRFNAGGFSYQQAIDHSKTLIKAARAAGVQRIVHISITNPSRRSDLGYFHGKAVVEKYLRQTGISYAILRPAVLFGPEDILINNIAWVLRRFPVFGVFGDGRYRLQPIYVGDLADLAVHQAQQSADEVIDAIGPETFTYRALVETMGEILGTPRPVITLPPRVGYAVGWAIGKVMGDVFLTWEEVQGLMRGLLYTLSPPAGERKLTDWVREHADRLGHSYASELDRRRDRQNSYQDL